MYYKDLASEVQALGGDISGENAAQILGRTPSKGREIRQAGPQGVLRPAAGLPQCSERGRTEETFSQQESNDPKKRLTARQPDEPFGRRSG